MKRNLLLGWISLFGVLAFAQEDPVVMRINGKEIPRSEFEYSTLLRLFASNRRLIGQIC